MWFRAVGLWALGLVVSEVNLYPVIVTITDNGKHIRVFLYFCSTTITGWAVLLRDMKGYFGIRALGFRVVSLGFRASTGLGFRVFSLDIGIYRPHRPI